MTEEQVQAQSVALQARIRAAIGSAEDGHVVTHALAQVFSDSCNTLVLLDAENLNNVKTWAAYVVQFAERAASLTKSVN